MPGEQETAKERHYGLTRRAAEIALAVGVVFVVFGIAVSASASESDDDWPRVYDMYQDDPSSRTCAEIAKDLSEIDDPPLDPDNLPDWQSFKIEDPDDGDYDGPLGIVISNYDDNSFDWTSTAGVDLVYVKSGSQGSRLYLYDPPTEGTSGTGLGTPQDISHITFCYDDDQPVTSTTTEPTTTSTTSTTSTTTTTVAPSTSESPTTSTTSTTSTTVAPSTSESPTTSTTSTSLAPTSSEAPTTTTSTIAPSSSTPPTTAGGPSSSTPPEEGPEVAGVKITRVEPESSSPLPVTGSTIGIPLMIVGALVLLGGGLSLLAHRRSQAESTTAANE